MPLQIIELVQGLTDALAPARCIGCLIEGTWYCANCRQVTPPHILCCTVCKEERPRGTTCISCREETLLTGVISAGAYSNQALQRGIEWLKFKGVRPIAEILAGLLIPHIPNIAPIQELQQRAMLVPLPLHTSRYRTRGFNQSEDIAHAIGRICDIQVAPLLKRASATASQAHLPHNLRTMNMEDAFDLAIREDEYAELVRNKPIIIIVDDVSTSGATLTSAASAFPIRPEIQIWGAVVARG